MRSRTVRARALGLVLLDQLSKRAFLQANFRNSIPFIKPAFNTAISFSLPIPRWFAGIVAAVVLVVLLRAHARKLISDLAFMLLFAGTLGNLIDRVRFGGVRDFISISSFPIFNVADVLLNIGVLVIIRQELGKKDLAK